MKKELIIKWRELSIGRVKKNIKLNRQWIFGKNSVGCTPLHRLAEHNTDVNVIKTLLKAGASINAKDKNGNTPLHYAAWNTKNPKIIMLLIRKGAKINERNKKGFTPFHIAAWNKHATVVFALVDAGADIYLKATEKYTPLQIAKKNGSSLSEIIYTE